MPVIEAVPEGVLLTEAVTLGELVTEGVLEGVAFSSDKSRLKSAFGSSDKLSV